MKYICVQNVSVFVSVIFASKKKMYDIILREKKVEKNHFVVSQLKMKTMFPCLDACKYALLYFVDFLSPSILVLFVSFSFINIF